MFHDEIAAGTYTRTCRHKKIKGRIVPRKTKHDEITPGTYTYMYVQINSRSASSNNNAGRVMGGHRVPHKAGHEHEMILCLSTKIAADILPVNTPTTNDTEKNDHKVGRSHRMGSRNR
jgi:hypothetical protein